MLINVGTKMDPEVPDPFFNHAIVCVDLGNRDYVLMDPTDENTQRPLAGDGPRPELISCAARRAKDIKLSPINPPEENMMVISTKGTLDAQRVPSGQVGAIV